MCWCAPPRSTPYARSVIRCSQAAQRIASSSGVFVVLSVADCSFATAIEVYHRHMRALIAIVMLVVLLAMNSFAVWLRNHYEKKLS